MSSTTKKSPSRARSFFITINKDIDKAIKVFKKESYVYLLIGSLETAPSTGHQHVHLFISYENQRNLSTMIKKFNKYGDVEVSYAKNINDIKTYLEKDGEIQFEDGEQPQQGKRTDISEALEECKTLAEFRLKHKDLFIRYHNGIKDYYATLHDEDAFDAMIDAVVNDDFETLDTRVYWITGLAGTGKTTRSFKLARELGYQNKDIGSIEYDKDGKFNNGIRVSAKCLIWTEFRDTQLEYADFLKLLDKFGTTVNIKGNKIFIKPETIIINTVVHLDEIYIKDNKKPSDREQIYRRIIKYYEMNKNKDYGFKEIKKPEIINYDDVEL